MFARDGFCPLGAVASPAVVEALRAEVGAGGEDGARSGPYGVIRHNPWTRVPACAEVTAALAASAAELLELDEVVLFQDVIVAKMPGTTEEIRWHQDYSYWPLDRPDGITLWVALDDADADNGCLRYIPGTHRLGERQPADFVIGAAQAPRPGLEPLDAEARAGEAVAVPVACGHALAHHPLVYHMSPGNPTDRPRRAWSITLLAPHVRWDTEHSPHPFNYQLGPRAGSPVEGELFPRFSRTRPGRARR